MLLKHQCYTGPYCRFRLVVTMARLMRYWTLVHLITLFRTTLPSSLGGLFILLHHWL